MIKFVFPLTDIIAFVTALQKSEDNKNKHPVEDDDMGLD